MAITHLGQDSYIRFQKEATYLTPLTNSMTFLPWTEGTLTYEVSQIEKSNLINSRVPQKPQTGRKLTGPSDLTFPIVPDLIGSFMNLFLGAASTAGDATTGYTHTWLVPIDGLSAGVSWTIQQAIGSDVADQYNGVKCSKILIQSDNEGIMTITTTLVGVDRDDNNVSRASSVTISDKTFYIFGDGLLQITPSGVSQFTQKVMSFELEIDLGYDEDGARFKVGSDTADTPIFGTIPSLMFRCEIDAERRFEDWANELKEFALDLTLTSPEQAGSSSGDFQFIAELPKMILESAVRREAANDNITMALDFKVADGGTTTGSGSDVVQGEIRVVDDTATYTGQS